MDEETNEMNIEQAFIVFIHRPFEEGEHGEENSQKIIDNLLYYYPKLENQQPIEHLMSIIISLYTYATLSLDDTGLDFIGWTNSKASIQTVQQDNGSLLFFVFKVSSKYPDCSVKQALGFIMKSFSFFLGNSISNTQDLSKFLNSSAPKILDAVFPNIDDQIGFSYPHLQIAESHHEMITTSLSELLLLNSDSHIWGVTCFIDNQVLVSTTDFQIVRCLTLVSAVDHETVYLSHEDRKKIVEQHNNKSQIPDLPMIETHLLEFCKGHVKFDILINPESPATTIQRIGEIIERTIFNLEDNRNFANRSQMNNNTATYDRELFYLKSGEISPEFVDASNFAHERFESEPRIKEIIVQDAKELTISANVLSSIEVHSSIPVSPNETFEDQFEECLDANPDLQQYIIGTNHLT